MIHLFKQKLLFVESQCRFPRSNVIHISITQATSGLQFLTIGRLKVYRIQIIHIIQLSDYVKGILLTHPEDNLKITIFAN